MDAVLPGESQRLQLQSASGNEHLSPALVKTPSCAWFALTLQLLSLGPDLQSFKLLHFLLKARLSVFPLAGSLEGLNC